MALITNENIKDVTYIHNGQKTGAVYDVSDFRTGKLRYIGYLDNMVADPNSPCGIYGLNPKVGDCIATKDGMIMWDGIKFERLYNTISSEPRFIGK